MQRNTLYLAQRVPYPPNKGEKIRTFNQIRYLIEQGHRIYVASPYETETELDTFEQLERDYPVKVQRSKLKGFIYRVLFGLLKNKPLSVTNFYCRELQQKIDSLLSTSSIQNIVCTSSSMAEYIFESQVINKLGEKKPRLIMDFMDLDSDKWLQYQESSAIPMKWIYAREARLLSRYENKVNDFFDVSFFISQAEVDLFSRDASISKKPLVVGNGIDNETFKPLEVHGRQNRDPVFLFTGVMDYKPNVDAVIWFTEKVWPLINQKFPEARFTIAGMNPVNSVLQLGEIKGIEVTGFVDDILPYYHGSDFFVAPLRIARGVQNKVLQAFSCGLPVISTSMGAEGIECRDGHNIFIADSPEEFLSSVETMCFDPGIYESVRENALKLTKNSYSWNAVLAKLDNILN